jgi:hypothetical protein
MFWILNLLGYAVFGGYSIIEQPTKIISSTINYTEI